MSRKVYFKSGDWNAVCDVCGHTYKASKLKKRWDGLMVCPSDYELRHPMDFLRAREDRVVPPWLRPRPEDNFLPTTINILDTIYLSENFNFVDNTPISASDNVSLSENISTFANYYRLIPIVSTQTNGVLNGDTLNVLAVNSSNTTFTNTTETLSLTESVSISKGFGKTVTDNITLTESVSTFKYVANPINQLAVNALFIG